MDLWVVAAAAGAGYLAKYWQNIVQDREGSSGVTSGSSFYDSPESPSLTQHIHDKTGAIQKWSPRKKDDHSFTETGNRNHSDRIYAGTSRLDGPLSTEGGKHEDVCMPSSSKYENLEDYKGGNRLDSGGVAIPEYHTWEMGASHGSRRSKKTLSEHLNIQFIKPRSSLDSCLMAQMYREHAELEEYLLSPLGSPCSPTLRPFLVTDGRRVISRASGHFKDGLHKEVYPKANDGVVGVPPLPQIGAADYSKEKLKKGRKRAGISNNASSLVQFDSQVLSGSSNGQVLFCLGISIGVISAILANKLELEKLKDSLKQSEGLVQDLQEELEMKDSITVKELAYDDDSQGTHENFSDKKVDIFSNQVDTTVLIKCADEESETVKVESMSKIEAELEAELERLELSMKVPSLHGMLTDGIEDYDEDVMAELVDGELNADIIQKKSSSEPTPDRGSSNTSTPLSVKQGVSPRELSLRLHEVIQTRLKERIRELEVELEKSRKRVRDLEAERINSWREVSNSESSSTLGSPMAVEAQSPMTRPLVMNLSGDALDAYNETFEELNKLKVSKNEVARIEVDSQQCYPPSSHLSTYRRQNGTQDCTMTLVTGEEPLPNVRARISSNRSSPNGHEARDDSDDDLLLIQQIVEKAKQGSPAVLRAQRAIFG